MGYLVHAYYSISPKRYYKDDSCWSADLKLKATKDIISIGSFMEVPVLNQYVHVRKILFSSTNLVLVLNTQNALLLIEYPTKNTSSDFLSNLPRSYFKLHIDKILEEDFDALLDEGSEIFHSIEGTILEEKLFAEFDEFMAMTADENSESEFDTEEPPFEKITFNTDYKIKTNLEEPPTDLELKHLPDNLEYVFLEEPSFLPVIISSQLSEENKNNSFDQCLNNLDKMLQRCKDAHLVLNWEKCYFMVKDGIMLGHKSDLACAEVMSLRTQVVAQQAVITELQAADRMRQAAITEILVTDRMRQAQFIKALKLLKRLRIQITKFERQEGPAKGHARPDAPEEAGSSS
ncbi:hypothetical protein Tco_0086944 [Tanacetum coccineum]